MNSSSSSPSSMEQVSKAVVQQEKPEWIGGFLEEASLIAASAHPIRGSQLNRYCTTCKLSGCQYCMTAGRRHRHHKILKIYRHVYQDAVLLSEMEKHLDCSQILCNQLLVIAVKPLPHLGGPTKSRCKTCSRRVTRPYRYCCLDCQVEALSSKSSGSSSAARFLGNHTSPNMVNKKRAPKPEHSLNKRKGKPSRAPFF
ncbi:hypothetical protein M0R45_006436 [Rubus argutus]|uniref:Uncharacterized protein n=1 Tax=Rubus argutus TaxID=59490 RepID=A0AAW1YQI3_RUBAR